MVSLFLEDFTPIILMLDGLNSAAIVDVATSN